MCTKTGHFLMSPKTNCFLMIISSLLVIGMIVLATQFQKWINNHTGPDNYDVTNYVVVHTQVFESYVDGCTSLPDLTSCKIVKENVAYDNTTGQCRGEYRCCSTSPDGNCTMSSTNTTTWYKKYTTCIINYTLTFDGKSFTYKTQTPVDCNGVVPYTLFLYNNDGVLSDSGETNLAFQIAIIIMAILLTITFFLMIFPILCCRKKDSYQILP